MAAFERICSGLSGLDTILDHIRLGDNVVWQVSSVEEYQFFVQPFCQQAVRDKRNILYMHFTGHPRLIAEDTPGIRCYEFDPRKGFESFTVSVRKRITEEGKDAFYVFDCLSDLQVAWATDLMMGNFFQVTCPYLFELDTVAYFPVLRGRHSFEAIARIRETTQLFLDIYKDGKELFINPLKVWNRYSASMFLPHHYESATGEFLAVKGGYEISRFYALVDKYANITENQNLDSWERLVNKAKMQYQADGTFTKETEQIFSHNMMSRDPRILELLEKYFAPDDYFQVYSRMVGSGGIGGKACGMLLARKVIQKDAKDAAQWMEPHDSFYIGSDVFYTYIVHNHFWSLRMKQKKPEGYFEMAPAMAEAFQKGVFPQQIREQFVRMLEYFGQCPIILRSSSLQEDGFGNAFAGKYESVFCINNGSMEERLEAVENAVRTVYASTMDRSALEYRRQRGLEQQDEQMAVLVQRVSGNTFDDFFMPNAAGVGYSYSSYRWSSEIDPSKGMLRLVMGLGTRAVDRTEGDYPRIVSLDRPEVSTLTDIREKHRFSQGYVDVMDYRTRKQDTRPLKEILPAMEPWYKKMVLEHDYEVETMYRERGQRRDVLFASCEGLVKNKEFIQCMKEVLRTLQSAYSYPVDIEFTVNGNKEGKFVFNLLQCRPLQIGIDQGEVEEPDFDPQEVLLDVENSAMGGSRRENYQVVVWVEPEAYYRYPYKEKPKVAYMIGELNRYFASNDPNSRMILFAPGRIGTSSPDLGVPVAFADIHHFSAVCEVSDRSAGSMPELSYGSHMFQDLVEAGIFYMAVFGNERTKTFRKDYFQKEENLLTKIFPKFPELEQIVKVYRLEGNGLTLYSDLRNEKTVFGKIRGSES
ncbi:MAG: PEP/pyruvate-binding domain-containing protein [Fusicatenibacter sp.]|nr:PEP/pyruvate-binding domain-containing protein [Fusicatenibacter sp.]